MKTVPSDLSADEIRTALHERWSIRLATLQHLPLGFGSHHWAAEADDGQQWFITVDDLTADHLGDTEEMSLQVLATAFATAITLRDSVGLSFVIAPVATNTGDVVHRLSKRYSMAVFPFLDIVPTEFGRFRDQADRDEALQLVGHVHNATHRTPVDDLRRDTLVIPNRAGLLQAMRSIDTPWNAGPFSEPARLLLRQHAGRLLQRLDHFDHLVDAVMRDTSDWVISHGEPHAGNVLHTRPEGMVIVDWDTVAFAPRERDLWMLVDEEDSDWSAYQDVTGVAALSPVAMEAYRIHWDLSEVAIYITWFRRPHEHTGDMEIGWASLQEYLTV